MLKHAYNLGFKLALAEAGFHAENPAEALAAVLQQIPEPEDPSKDEREVKGVGDPADDTSYGARSSSWGFDDLSQYGIDIRGPESTSV